MADSNAASLFYWIHSTGAEARTGALESIIPTVDVIYLEGVSLNETTDEMRRSQITIGGHQAKDSALYSVVQKT